MVKTISQEGIDCSYDPLNDNIISENKVFGSGAAQFKSYPSISLNKRANHATYAKVLLNPYLASTSTPGGNPGYTTSTPDAISVGGFRPPALYDATVSQQPSSVDL